MSFLEKLHEVKVEWKALGDIGSFTRGKRFVKTDMTSEGVPCIHYGEMYTHYGVWAEESKSFLDERLAKKLRFANCGDVIIVAAGETIEDIGNGTAWLSKNDVVIHDACFSYKSDLNPKYVSYFLRTNSFKEQIKKSISSGKISAINENGLSKALIPIPYPENPKKSLKIQSEIVRILDAFSAMTVELTTKLTYELSMRKKQYNYYRDQLLSLQVDEVHLRPLIELTLPTNNIRWKENEESFRYIDLTSVSRETNTIIKTTEITADNAPSRAQKIVEENDVIFATTRPTQLRKCLINKTYAGAIASTGYCILRAKSSLVLPKWIYFYLSSTDFFKYLEDNQSGSAYPAISDSKVKEFKLPIPYPDDPEKSLAEQARIVSILEKFDEVFISITKSLPCEIERRQQQYDYYRDLLFSFPKSKMVEA